MMRRFGCFSLVSALLAATLAAQDAPPPGKREHDRSLGQMSVIDKFLGIEATIGPKLNPPKTTDEHWAPAYAELYKTFRMDATTSKLPGGGEDRAIVAMALGVKASDAVIALKAQDIEELNKCATQIEALAVKLGATQKELGMADTVKRYANQRRWLDAFLALGFLQRSVLNYLKEHKEREAEATLVVVGGWMQGGRCVTQVVNQHYGPEVSNILRDPRLVDLIKENMDKLPPEYAGKPIVQLVNKLLPQIRQRVAIGFNDAVRKDDVMWLHETFDEVVKSICIDDAKPATSR